MNRQLPYLAPVPTAGEAELAAVREALAKTDRLLAWLEGPDSPVLQILAEVKREAGDG